MSLVDTTFSGIPPQLINEWGQSITYIKSAGPCTYDPTTGTVEGSDVSVALKAVITRLNPRENEGLYQTTDIKMYVSAAELGSYYPSEADRVQYQQDGQTREAKILSITSYRGDNPILHVLIARPQ